MSILDRYLLREIAVPFVVGMGLFFVVVAFAQLLKISDAVTGLGITGSEAAQAFLYSLPPLLGLLIPVSALFATLLGVGRIASDREVVAMGAAGLSPYRLLRVPAAMGLLLALVSAFALMVGEPWGVRELRSLMTRSAQRALTAGVRAGEFHEWVRGVTFLARKSRANELSDVMFADRRDAKRPVVISARHGFVVGGERAQDLVFDLRDGAVVLEDQNNGTYRVVGFERGRYRVDVGGLVSQKTRTLSSTQAKSLAELWHDIHDPAHADRRPVLTIVFQRKFALPLATIIFSLLAVTFACRPTGGSRARGFLYSAAIVGAYYYFGRAVELASRSDVLDPVLAAWTPNLLGLGALLVLLVRLKRRAAA